MTNYKDILTDIAELLITHYERDPQPLELFEKEAISRIQKHIEEKQGISYDNLQNFAKRVILDIKEHHSDPEDLEAIIDAEVQRYLGSNK